MKIILFLVCISFISYFKNAQQGNSYEITETVRNVASHKVNEADFVQQKRINLFTGSSFPIFKYKDVNQKMVSLVHAKGRRGTLVIFWASWCGPCRDEIPALKKIYAEYKSKGINLVSISIDHDRKAWKKALALEKMPWPNLSNLPGDYNEIMKKYNVNGIPAIYLLDAKNTVVMSNECAIPEVRKSLIKLSKVSNHLN